MTEDEAYSIIVSRVSRETLDHLHTYHRLLLKWQQVINLVSPSTIDQAWTRHFLDSVQLLDAVERLPDRWIDLGSGGGFPALVCAIASADLCASTHFELVETDTRKCAFLRQVVQETDINVDLHNKRIEEMPPLEAPLITARALAPLPQLLPLVYRHLAPGGVAFLQKGKRHAAELEQAGKDWHMSVETIPSVTATDSVILRIRNLEHA